MIKGLFLLLLILVIRLITFHDSSFTFKNKNTNDSGKIVAVSTVKNKVAEVFYKTIPQDHAALLLGIILGEKGKFSPEYNKAIEKTGVMHVIAASGMNVSMLSAFLIGLFLLFVRRQYALVMASIAVVMYAALANFEPSIVRASIMAIIAFGAGLIGRQNTSLYALFLAGFVMIFFDPLIIEDVGFQLSFMATIGIILINPIFARIMSKNAVSEDGMTTMSAQVTTVPILLFFFGSYSPISIITNLFILWVVPPLMILGGVAAIFSLFMPVLSIPFIYLSLPFLVYFKSIVMITSQFAYEFSLDNPPWLLIAGYYLILLSLILLYYKKRDLAR